MRLTLAQIDPTIGDIPGNLDRARRAIRAARRSQHAGAAPASLIVLPELVICGYPPRDLLLRDGFVAACERAIHDLAREAVGITAIVGTPWRAEGPRGVRNAAVVLRDGAIVARHDKLLLPGYDVFDEDRYFDPGSAATVVDVDGTRVAVAICEDLWRGADAGFASRYPIDPVDAWAAARRTSGCDLLVALSASPFVRGKDGRHMALLRSISARLGIPVAQVNQVGANDDLIFDGRSAIIRPDGGAVRLPAFVEAAVTVELMDGRAAPAREAGGAEAWSMRPLPVDDADAETFAALTCAIRGYVRKTGHERVLIGLSGGIDSAVTAALAAAALGAGAVQGVLMPSRYSSPGSIDDALDLVRRLGLPAPLRIPIEPGHAALSGMIGAALPGAATGVTDENIQSRLRGVVLMGLSNGTGALVLSTGNKSELAVGYATLYGDMCGAIAPLGDLVKTRVSSLARWMNASFDRAGFSCPPIPEASIAKPPSAELRPDQRDQDTLPAYDVLDDIVERLIDGEAAPEEIEDAVAARGRLPVAEVRRIIRAIDRAEYKRFQAAVIPKLTPRAFGRGRPWPVVAGAGV